MDTILTQLATAQNVRSSEPNKQVAKQCLQNPKLLSEIEQGLHKQNADLCADCAEVCTEIALQQPQLIVPIEKSLWPYLSAKQTRLRWEAMHAIALIAGFIPKSIQQNLQLLESISLHDPSKIVRNYALEALARFAQTHSSSAQMVLPLLTQNAEQWLKDHEKQVIQISSAIFSQWPQSAAILSKIAQSCLKSSKKIVQKEAQKLLNQIEKSSK